MHELHLSFFYLLSLLHIILVFEPQKQFPLCIPARGLLFQKRSDCIHHTGRLLFHSSFSFIFSVFLWLGMVNLFVMFFCFWHASKNSKNNNFPTLSRQTVFSPFFEKSGENEISIISLKGLYHQGIIYSTDSNFFSIIKYLFKKEI